MLSSLLFLGLAVSAQTRNAVTASNAPAVVIGQTTIRLGMTGDAAAAQLQTQYQVSVHGAAPTSQLWLTTTGNSFPFAVLYVHDRVVVGVEHSLLDREIESSDDLFNALFTVSAKLADEHRATCQLDTGSAYLADARLSKAFITMNCGPYRVVVLRNEFKGADGKSIAGYIVREELGQTD
jgi:hypothetical protein